MGISAIIDADGHIVEQDTLLFEYLPPPFRGRRDLLSFPFFPSLDGWHRAARRVADGKGRALEAPDAQAWLHFLDSADIELSVLYPTHGLSFGLIKDREWAAALARAYNDFLADRYLKVSPRLKGMALIPLQDVTEAVRELRRAVEDLGMLGAVLPAVGLRTPLGHRSFDLVYEEAERLGCLLAVHGAPAQGLGFDFFENLIEARTLSHPFAQMIQMVSIVLGGVLDRFPRVRLAFMEAGAGWVPYLVERLDLEYEHRTAAVPLSRPPSDHLRSGRVFFHCELEEKSLPYALAFLGEDLFFYASDYPHEPPGEIREGVEEFLRRDLSESAKEKILSGTARRMYRFR